MDIEAIKTFLGWCSIINIAVLLLWSVAIVFARGFVYELNSRWFSLSQQTIEVIHYCGIGLYKIMVFVFFVIPYLVIHFNF